MGAVEQFLLESQTSHLVKTGNKNNFKWKCSATSMTWISDFDSNIVTEFVLSFMLLNSLLVNHNSQQAIQNKNFLIAYLSLNYFPCNTDPMTIIE